MQDPNAFIPGLRKQKMAYTKRTSEGTNLRVSVDASTSDFLGNDRLAWEKENRYSAQSPIVTIALLKDAAAQAGHIKRELASIKVGLCED